MVCIQLFIPYTCISDCHMTEHYKKSYLVLGPIFELFQVEMEK